MGSLEAKRPRPLALPCEARVVGPSGSREAAEACAPRSLAVQWQPSLDHARIPPATRAAFGRRRESSSIGQPQAAPASPSGFLRRSSSSVSSSSTLDPSRLDCLRRHEEALLKTEASLCELREREGEAASISS